MRISLKKGLGICALVLLGTVACAPVQAQIAHLPDNIQEVLKSAWPETKHIQSRAYYLSQKQHQNLERLLQVDALGRMHTFYIARAGGRASGQSHYGIFDSHIVRTKSETLFFVMDGHGVLDKIDVLAFHEPDEYRAPQRWLKQFYGQRLTPEKPSLAHRVDALSGATLTRKAVLQAAAKVMLLHSVHVQK